MSRFHSILFEGPADDSGSSTAEPDYFGDLNLDQVRDALLAGREEYELEPFFHAPLHDPGGVSYRHEVFRDLRRDTVRKPIESFASHMGSIRDLLVRTSKAHYKLHQQRLQLEAINRYCEAVLSLAEGLGAAELESRALRGLRTYLEHHVASQRFTGLVGETRALFEALGEIRYSLHINEARVQVDRYQAERDFGAAVRETFAKFKEGASEPQVVQPPGRLEMNHVEARILELVAKLHPEVFARLADYCDRHRQYVDAKIGAFDRGIQFYLAWLEYIAPLERVGLDFCLPEISTGPSDVFAEQAFDVALASKLAADDGVVVCNDFELTPPERILVVTGPNQGGKTTFARMVGQLHHLAALGVPVPARRARLSLPARVFTHFEREENLATLSGKLEDELVRVREILEHATDDSVIVMNESFASTTVADTLFLGTELIGRISELGALCVYVTFVDELSRLGRSTVSMVATVARDDPAERTFKVIRRVADGRAYAAAIAHKYGLEYETLKDRVAG